MRLRVAALALLLIAVLAVPAAARAQTSVAPPVAVPESLDLRIPGFSTTAREAIAAADRTPEVREARREDPGLEPMAEVWDSRTWSVSYLTGEDEFVVAVELDSDGRVFATWTGIQASAYFTRDPQDGLPLWAFAAFALAFVAPFLDPRRLRRLLHLDLLALLAVMVPFGLLAGRMGTAAILAIYPPLIYLIARMLALAAGRGRTSGEAVPWMPGAVLAIGLVVLVAARVYLNLVHDEVVDVGYASVVGADRVMHDEPLYAANDVHGDTYGPLNYIAYVPFELLFPWSGVWDALPAAHAAAITFDVLTIAGLVVLGRQISGTRLGLALGWAWAAYPVGLFALMKSTNDGLVALMVVWALVAASRPVARGALLGAAAAVKFFPAALIGVLWRGRDRTSPRQMAVTALSAAGIFALAVLLYLPGGGLREFWDCTLGFQLSRPSDFSLWGEYGLRPLQLAVTGGALLLGVAAGLWPRGRRSVVQLSALAAAILLALQIGAGHWYFFYVSWFVPIALVALMGSARGREPRPVTSAPAREPEAVLVAH